MGAIARNPGKVKGTLLLARMRYLRARGPQSADRVLRRMTEGDRAVLEASLLPSSWYPADLLLRLEMTIAAVLSRGDRLRMFVEMGRFTADTNLGPSGLQRPYVREGDPHFLLRNLPRLYGSQHTVGTRTYEPAGARAAVVRTMEAEDVSADDCLTAVGWLARAIEMSGGRSPRVLETQCRARGGRCCEYRCEWD